MPTAIPPIGVSEHVGISFSTVPATITVYQDGVPRGSVSLLLLAPVAPPQVRDITAVVERTAVALPGANRSLTTQDTIGTKDAPVVGFPPIVIPVRKVMSIDGIHTAETMGTTQV